MNKTQKHVLYFLSSTIIVLSLFLIVFLYSKKEPTEPTYKIAEPTITTPEPYNPPTGNNPEAKM